MRIAWLEPPTLAVQGDQIYRTVQPCRSLAELGGSCVVAGNWLQPVMHEAAETADVLVLCQAVDIDFLPLMARRRQAGLTTLVELNDNFLEPRAFGDVGNFYHQAGHVSLVMQLARRADGLLVSTPYLAQLFGGLNEALLLLPNSIDCPTGAEHTEFKRAASSVRLGWAGSEGHAPDVAAAVPALKTLMARYPQLTLCIMASEALHPLFAWAPKDRLDLRRATNLRGYMDFIATWDVGIAPLMDTPFNRGRSDVKFLEYTANGVATVASRGPAYHTVLHNETGLLVDGAADFVEPVAALIDAPELRRSLVARARAYVAQHRGHARQHQPLVDCVRAHAPRAAGAEADSAWFARLTAGREGSTGAQFCYLEATAEEAQLYRALRAQQDASDTAPMQAVQSSLPRCYLPHLYAGAASRDAAVARRHLERARALAPQSTAVAHHLTRTHLAAGDAAGAMAVAEDHLKGGPNPYHYAPLWELLATAHSAHGHAAAQARALDQALQCNPAYGPPARALAALIESGELQAQDPSLAEQLRPVATAALRRNLAGHHGDFMDALALGRLAARAGAWPEASSHFHNAFTLAQQAQHEDGIKLSLAWLAKGALAAGNMAQARAWLQHPGRERPGPVASAPPMTQ